MPALPIDPFVELEVDGGRDRRVVADLALELQVGAARAAPGAGTRTSVSISSGAIEVVERVDQESSIGTSRSPAELLRDHARAEREHHRAQVARAGRRAPSDPPIVPRFRTIGSAICGAAAAIVG